MQNELRSFKELPTIETERLILRHFIKEDYNSYNSWHRGDVVNYMQGLHNVHETDAYERLFFTNAPRMYQTKESIIWSISEKTTNICINKFEMCKFDFCANKAQIHYCLAKEYRGKGYMTEDVNEVVKWAFCVARLNRLETGIWEDNIPSSRVLIKCRFTLEGVRRQASINKYTQDGEL